MGFLGTRGNATSRRPPKWGTLHSLATSQSRATETQGNPPRNANICSFIQRLKLLNSTIAQVMAKIWHNSQPQKVDTLIWFTLNRGLLIGTWLQCMGILPTCKVCTEEAPEFPQHCFLECPLAKRAWEAFITSGKNGDRPMTSLSPGHSSSWVKPSWRKLTPLGVQGYHVRGFSYIKQSFDILSSFILYFLWSEGCQKHFDNQYPSRKILQQA